MKNFRILLLFGLLCASVAADDDSNEFESEEIIIDIGPAEPVVTQYSSSSVVQQNERKVQPIEIITPFGYQGIFDSPQQYFSASSFQGLRQYFPALLAALGQTNIPLQSIQQSQFSQPPVVSRVQSSFNPDGTIFFLNRNILPVSGVSNIGGEQPASQTGAIGVNQPVPPTLQYSFGANQNRAGFQSASGYVPQQQLTFGSASTFAPEQFIPGKASFSQFGTSSNQPLRNPFSVSQPFSAIGQNSVVPTFESNSLISPAIQPSFAVGGQSFPIPVPAEQQYQGIQVQQPSITQQIPSIRSDSLGFFSSTLRQPTGQPISIQNPVVGQQSFSTLPQVSTHQSSAIAQQEFGQPFATAQQAVFGQPSATGQSTFGQPSAITQQFGQPSATGQSTFGQPSAITQQFGQPSAIGQPTFGQPSAITQHSIGLTSVTGQSSAIGQPTFGQASAIRQQSFGPTSAGGQQTTFGQAAAVDQQPFGQPSTIGQPAFGQTSVGGQQASFGAPSGAPQKLFEEFPVDGQQFSAVQQASVRQQGFNDNSFTLSQPQTAGQETRFTQSSFGAQPAAFSSSASFSQPSTFQAGGQNSFSPQVDSAVPQPVLVNQPAFGAVRSDPTTQAVQSSFGVNEFPNFESQSAAFKTDVTKVGQDLNYDGSIGDAKFNSGFDFDESESFDTKVYDHV